MNKITRIETFTVPPRWIFVRVETDDGTVGWGEAIVPKRKSGIVGTISDLAQNLIGRDVSTITHFAQSLRKGSFFRDGPVLSSALAGIEIALWDIKGKQLSAPIYELKGGSVRDKIQSYGWINGETTDALVAHAKKRVEQGFDAVKLTPKASIAPLRAHEEIDDLCQRISSVRDALGAEIGIAVDLHGRFSRASLKPLIKELDAFSLMWIEEAFVPDYDENLAHLARACPHIPIATGERLITPGQFKRLMDAGTVDIVQPDISLTGLSNLEMVARLAEIYDVLVAPHSPNGPMCLAASMQVGFSCPSVTIQETSWGLDYKQSHKTSNKGEMSDYVLNSDVLMPVDGWLPQPKGPGLGLEVDEKAVRAAHADWTISDANWAHPDGSFAEW
ncbi:galactonate dehydratase [Cognatishimia maritima]|nr:galactonate dehydratase [Cognatishimia maritima]